MVVETTVNGPLSWEFGAGVIVEVRGVLVGPAPSVGVDVLELVDIAGPV
jgi:hypothetical protein